MRAVDIFDLSYSPPIVTSKKRVARRATSLSA